MKSTSTLLPSPDRGLHSTHRAAWRTLLIGFSSAAALMLMPTIAAAADPEFVLKIKDHRFEPAELKLPAQTKIKLIVHNLDAQAEEFESKSLNREKIIPAGGKVTIFIGPLKSGRYEFVGEYNEATAKGVFVVE
jgi:hypothetical protein